MASSLDKDKSEMLASFVDITGSESERARFFLEASGWQLQVALADFFENSETDQGMEESAVIHSSIREALNSGQQTQREDSDTEADRTSAGVAGGLGAMLGGLAGAFASRINPSASQPQPPSAPTNKKQDNKGPTTATNRMVTLDSLKSKAREGHSEGSSEEDEEQGQAFFAGGSQQSGQQILGPPPKKRDDMIADIFKKAREQGAEEVNASGGGGGASSFLQRKPQTFGGAGYKLGENTSDSHVVQDPSKNSEDGRGEREVVLQLWSNGFTIDGGQLRSYQDPNNMEFLNSVKRGEIPMELIASSGGAEVSLTMEDHRGEEYAPRKASPASKAFAGKGQVLGSPAPVTIGSTSASTSEADKAANEKAAQTQSKYDENSPSTNIQLRLSDGSRLVARFNHSHTIRDLHNYINTARPQYANVNYVLTLFPNRELTKQEESIKDANLLNSALIQKIKN